MWPLWSSILHTWSLTVVQKLWIFRPYYSTYVVTSTAARTKQNVMTRASLESCYTFGRVVLWSLITSTCTVDCDIGHPVAQMDRKGSYFPMVLCCTKANMHVDVLYGTTNALSLIMAMYNTMFSSCFKRNLFFHHCGVPNCTHGHSKWYKNCEFFDHTTLHM